jgi:hypothetical protein
MSDDVNTHDESNYEVLSPAFEAAMIADMLEDWGDAKHQGDGTILFSDRTPREEAHYRLTVERLD